MRIIELPFKKEQVFRYKGDYYISVPCSTNLNCEKCDLNSEYIYCLEFSIKCSNKSFFKKIKQGNYKNVLDLPLESDDILKFENKYFRTVKFGENSCMYCDASKKYNICLGHFVVCIDSLAFKELNEYEVLFLNKGEKYENNRITF